MKPEELKKLIEKRIKGILFEQEEVVGVDQAAAQLKPLLAQIKENPLANDDIKVAADTLLTLLEEAPEVV
jgi:hypothetical protein